MNKKTTIIFGIILVLILIFVAYSQFKKEVPVGGTSMYDSTSTFSQGLIVSGVYDMGAISSASSAASLTAAQFCRANWVTIDPTLAPDEETNGASISMPTEAALIADCLPTVGACKSITLESLSSVSAARIGVALGDSDITLDFISSDSASYFDVGDIVDMKACVTKNTPVGIDADGVGSVSWSWEIRTK